MSTQSKMGVALMQLGAAGVLAGPVVVLGLRSSALLPLLPWAAAAFAVGFLLLLTARR